MGGQTNFEFVCLGRMTIVRFASGSASGKCGVERREVESRVRSRLVSCREFLSILNIRFAFGHGGDHSNYEGSMMKPFYFPSTLLAV
jgi:hypothetical protein